jgi:hypothetical protein
VHSLLLIIDGLSPNFPLFLSARYDAVRSSLLALGSASTVPDDVTHLTTYLTTYLTAEKKKVFILSNSIVLLHFSMPSKLPDNIKSNVIQQWLAGRARDKIAFDCGISTGAVSNITNEWKMALVS